MYTQQKRRIKLLNIAVDDTIWFASAEEREDFVEWLKRSAEAEKPEKPSLIRDLILPIFMSPEDKIPEGNMDLAEIARNCGTKYADIRFHIKRLFSLMNKTDMDNEGPFDMNSAQAAVYIGRTTRFLATLARNRELPAEKRNRVWWFNRATLSRWLKRNGLPLPA